MIRAVWFSLRRIKLKTQLLLILLSIPIILVSELLYYTASQQVDIKNKPLEQLAVSTSRNVAEKLDRCIYDRCSEVKLMSKNSLALSLLEGKSSQEEMIYYMNSVIGNSIYYDLIMLCDVSGKIVAVNTNDSGDQKIATNSLIGSYARGVDWFNYSTVVGGPVGGVYYSDFNEDELVETLYRRRGFGMDFSVPILTKTGDIVGVLRVRAKWEKLSQDIRKEAEEALQQTIVDGLILLMDKQGRLIDADDQSSIQKVSIGKNNIFKDFNFNYATKEINSENYIYGWTEANGVYSYKGNKWKLLTLLPKVRFRDKAVLLDYNWLSLVGLSLVLLLLGIFASLLFIRSFSIRLDRLVNAILKLSLGERAEAIDVLQNDEIGAMVVAVNKLSENFSRMVVFTETIGQGSFSAEFSPVGKDDLLGNSLLKMRDGLVQLQAERQVQYWVSEGLTKVNELLREHKQENRYQLVLSYIAKRINATQAIVYFVEYDKLPVKIKAKAGYALAKNHLMSEPLELGEDIVGQVVVTKKSTLLTEIPDDYAFSIASGLGSAVPKVIIIIPMIYNERVEGVLEFSFLSSYEDHYEKFIKQVGSYIGADYYQQQFLVKEYSE